MGYKIVFDTERMRKVATNRDYIAFQDGDYKSRLEMMAKFIFNEDGGYLDAKDGYEYIMNLTLAETEELLKGVDKLSDELVPPMNAAL